MRECRNGFVCWLVRFQARKEEVAEKAEEEGKAGNCSVGSVSVEKPHSRRNRYSEGKIPTEEGYPVHSV